MASSVTSTSKKIFPSLGESDFEESSIRLEGSSSKEEDIQKIAKESLVSLESPIATPDSTPEKKEKSRVRALTEPKTEPSMPIPRLSFKFPSEPEKLGGTTRKQLNKALSFDNLLLNDLSNITFDCVHEFLKHHAKKIKVQPNQFTCATVKSSSGESMRIYVIPEEHAKREGHPIDLKEAYDLNVYVEESFLGSGASGVVYKIKSLLTKDVMVIKIPHKKDIHLSDDDPDQIKFAQNAQESIENELVISNYIWTTKPKARGLQYHLRRVVFHQDPTVASASVLYEGTNARELLTDETFQQLPLRVKLRSFLSILRGATILETLEILHLDLKLENLFFVRRWLKKKSNVWVPSFKIADFGGAKIIKDNPLDPKFIIEHTPAYMPTYDLGSKTLGRFFSHKTAVYQLGVILYELLTKKSPYKPDPINTGSPRHYHPTEEEIKTFKDPKDLEAYFDAQSLRDLSLPEDAVLLIEQMCHPLPSERPTAAEIMDKWESICCQMRLAERQKKKSAKEATSSI